MWWRWLSRVEGYGLCLEYDIGQTFREPLHVMRLRNVAAAPVQHCLDQVLCSL